MEKAPYNNIFLIRYRFYIFILQLFYVFVNVSFDNFLSDNFGFIKATGLTHAYDICKKCGIVLIVGKHRNGVPPIYNYFKESRKYAVFFRKKCTDIKIVHLHVKKSFDYEL